MSSMSVKLSQNGLGKKRCFIGFDAFVDYITKPIARREGGKAGYFGSLEEYADFLHDQKNKSFSIELEIPRVRMGGNNPIISDIMSRFGVDVVTAGPYGIPELNPLFQPLSKQCKIISFSNPGICNAYEFSFNKIMNYYNMDARDFTYKRLLEYISEEELISIIDKTDLVIVVNIGEQPAMMNILETMTERILKRFCKDKNFFVDFSDCSRMSLSDLSRSIYLLGALNQCGKTMLSVNENEFQVLYRYLVDSETVPSDMKKGVSLCRKKLPIESLVLRTLHHFYYSSAEEEIIVDNSIVESPLYITGAGDAQNAGICLGILDGLPVKEALETGVWVGNSYIRTGSVRPLYRKAKVKAVNSKEE
jgi:hypothetical protein